MQKILIVANSLSYGGATKMLLWVANMLSNEWEVEIVYVNDVDLNYDLILNSFRLTSKPLKKDILSRNSINIFLQSYNFYKLIKKNKYDLIINFGDHAIYSLCLTKFFLKFKLLVSERVDPFSSRRFSDKCRRFLYRYADNMVFQTKEAAEYFSPKVQRYSKIIPNPVVGTTEIKWNINVTEDSIITIGRIDIIQKRQDILLAAFKKVLEDYPHYKLKIVGSGMDEKKMFSIIKNLNIENNIEILGYKKNIPELLVKSKLFVLASDFEGIPNALIEALQVNMPVISTNCSPGGAALLLDNGKYGIITEKSNIDELYKAMKEAISSKEKLEAMAKKTEGALDRFSEDKISELWVNYIKQCS